MAWERKAWSSTRLGLVARHCPRALDFADADTPRDRSIFETGIAAHHILQAVGEHQRREDRLLEPEDFEAIAANVLRHLVAEGRLFEGRPEPPLVRNPWRQGHGGPHRPADRFARTTRSLADAE